MTVNDTQTRQKYTADGVQRSFAVPFKFFADADLAVAVRLEGATVDTVQALNTDYAVSGAGNAGGGTVTFTSPPANDAEIAITRSMTFEQQADYVAGDPFPAESHEAALDRLVMMLQQLRDETDRAIKALPTSSTEPFTGFPEPSGLLEQLLGFDTSDPPQLKLFDPATVISHGTTANLTDHADVQIAGRAAGDILVDDGTKYVNLPSGSAGEILTADTESISYKLLTLDDTSGVSIDGTPADNEVLAYDTASGDFINQTAAEAGLVPDTRTISTGEGLTGGGALSTNLTLGHDLAGLTEAVSPSAGDWLLLEEASGAAIKKVQAGAIGAGGTHLDRNIRNGLVAYWKLDEASGNAVDTVGFNDLTDTNTVAQGSAIGPESNSRDFTDTSSEYFTLASASTKGLDGFSQITTMGWFQADVISTSPTTNANIVGSWGAGGNRDWAVNINGDALKFYCSNDGTAIPVASSSAGRLVTGVTYFFAATFDGRYLKLYTVKNGTDSSLQLEASAEIGTNDMLGLAAVSSSFDIGRLANSSVTQHYLNGRAESISLWNRAMSIQELTWWANLSGTTAQGRKLDEWS